MRTVITILAVVLKNLVPFLKKRLEFERKNLVEESSITYKKINKRADFCFEVSSEGELEQVKPLIEIFLTDNKCIELLFSSPSVEKKCLKLYADYPEQVRLLRLPLLSFFPFPFLYFQALWFWVSAPVLIFCRYDFFPELLSFKIFGKKMVLLSGAIKKESWYKNSATKLFDIIVATSMKEKEKFNKVVQLKDHLYHCDLRIPRITQRQTSAALVLKKALGSYADYLDNLPFEQKVIVGSFWPSDREIFNSAQLQQDIKAKKCHLLIVPHKLDDESIEEIRNIAISYFGEVNVGVLSQTTTYTNTSVVILKMSGILCELYTKFHVSYVGGGYERSIHSVLEPYFSYSKVVVGTKIERSTEYDFLNEIAPSEIHVLNSPETFYTIFKSLIEAPLDEQSRVFWQKKSAEEMQKIISELQVLM